MEDTLLLQKEVDKSVLFQGLTIPQAFHDLFFERIGFRLAHGENRKIKLLFLGQTYEAELWNQGFNQNTFIGHGDVVQIRYSGAIVKKLREEFACSYQSVLEFRSNPENKRKVWKPAADKREVLVLYATPEKGTIFMDAISQSEYAEETKALSHLNEIDFELAIDQNATILIETRVCKVRRLSKAIGNSLKIVYGYRCQICGQYIGEQYGSDLIHTHHIDYFTKSLNNDADNILIVCPNHHGIIHDTNPEFDRNTKTYLYPNGYREGLKLNVHL